LVAERTGAKIRVAEITPSGEIDLESLSSLLNERTRVVGVVHISNALGTINPVSRIAEMAHGVGALVLVDGAQALAHGGVDVRRLGCDFYAMSGHKSYGPTGIGALYAREELLDAMPPFMGGGEMIREVRFAGTTYAEAPARFEAGTPNVAGAVGWVAALEFIEGLGREAVAEYERSLVDVVRGELGQTPGARMIGEGSAGPRGPVVSFVVEGVHPHDLGTYLDTRGVAVRTGHHCTQPLMEFFGVPATTRVSLACHSTPADIERFGDALRECVEFFR